MNSRTAPLSRLAPLALAIALAACAKPPVAEEAARLVRVQVIAESGARQAASYAGEIRARREDALGFQVAGRVQRRLVEVGQHVAAGTPLMQLDPVDAALNLRAYRAALDSAKSQLAQAQADHRRYEALAARRYVGPSELEKSRLSLQTARESVRSAEANWRIAQNQQGYTMLRATADGVVTSIEVEAGQVVQAGQVAVRIAEDGERELATSVPESRVAELRAAESLEIELWADSTRRYRGRLRELAPDTDDVTRTYAAKISVLDADAAVHLGMTARLAITLPGTPGVYRLPLTAIDDTDGRPRVWTVDPKTSRVATKPVTLANVARDVVLVSGGLDQGDIVVTAGAHLLHASQKVKLPDMTAPAPKPAEIASTL